MNAYITLPVEFTLLTLYSGNWSLQAWNYPVKIRSSDLIHRSGWMPTSGAQHVYTSVTSQYTSRDTYCDAHNGRYQPAWASCQIRKFAGAHAPGMPGTCSPSPQVSDPDMHQGTCVTHVPWCMPGSLTSGFLWNRRRGKTFPAFPAHAQPAILRIW